MEIGVIKGFEINKNRDNTLSTVLLQCKISDDSDIQTVELINEDGVDSRPPKESRIIIVPVGEAFKVGISIDDKVAPDAALLEGEKKIYSSESGTVKAFIKWLKSGVIELNGNADFAVRYTALESKLQELITAINAETTAINNIYPYPRSAITVDFSGAKIDEVTTP